MDWIIIEVLVVIVAPIAVFLHKRLSQRNFARYVHRARERQLVAQAEDHDGEA